MLRVRVNAKNLKNRKSVGAARITAGLRIGDYGFETRDTECEIWDRGFGIGDMNVCYGIRDFGFRIRDSAVGSQV